MAGKAQANDKIQDSIQVALDAADTASGVTEEFHILKEQFEVVNIQAKRIYNSVLIIFLSSIVAGLVSLGAASLMYYKALGVLKTNSNVSIEALAIFTENVAKLDESIKLVETNTENQETIKTSLVELESSAKKATSDISGAGSKYTKAIKIAAADIEKLIQDFATKTLKEIQSETEETQNSLIEQISNMEKFFSKADSVGDETGEDGVAGDKIVTYRQFQALENKVDQLIMLQKDLSAKIFEMNKVAKAAVMKKKKTPKKVKRKPAANPLKFP